MVGVGFMGVMSGQTFFVEDVCALKGQPTKIGLIERTFHDIDSHIANPLKHYDNGIQRHKDTPKRLYTSFLRTGVPPRDHVLVTWPLDDKTELVPENKLSLMDRSLLEGDVVKRHIRDPQSGTVLRTSTRCILRPPCLWPEPQASAKPLKDAWTRAFRDRSRCLLDIPSAELQDAHQYRQETIIIYKNWIGRIDDVVNDVTVRLCNGSVVVVEDPDDLTVPGRPSHESPSVGEMVETLKGNLRRGRWIYGAYDPNIEPCGYVAEVRTTSMSVEWLGFRQEPPAADRAMFLGSPPKPPNWLGLDDLETGEVVVYDRSRTPPPGKAKTTYSEPDRSFPFITGEYVRFKDLSGASVKYGNNKSPHGTFSRIPRSKALGYDINVFEILRTKTSVTVLWQDGNISEHESTELVPDPNVDDEQEVWPGEIVATQEQATHDGPEGLFTPSKVGVVQSVKASERIASVRWFANPLVDIIDEDRTLLSPSSRTGPLGTREDVSLYEVASFPALNKRLGDLVILRERRNEESVGLDWIGEVVELGLDGLLTVRLGALEEVQDIRVPIERIVWSHGTDDASEDGASAYLDLSDASDDSMSEVSEDMEEEMPDLIEETIEYGDGTRMDQDSNDDAWSTESEGDDENPDRADHEDGDVFEDARPYLDEAMSDASQVNRPNGHGAPPETVDTPMKDSQPSPAQPRSQTQNAPALYSRASAPVSFAVLESDPSSDHAYLQPVSSISGYRLRRIQKEYKILQESLPEGIFVRTWESRLDLLRVLIIGPLDTPYEFAPFVIDFRLGPSFPSSPPDAFFHSWTTNGKGPINPNLYEDGKICLSLLGTWDADEKSESWSAACSTLLQVLVSLLGLVLVKEPYYNEAGFDVYADTEVFDIPSALYSERTYFRSRAFILHALQNPVQSLEDEIRWLYLSKDDGAPRLLERAVASANGVIARSAEEVEKGKSGGGGGGDGKVRDGLRRISKGAVVPLRRHVDALGKVLEENP